MRKYSKQILAASIGIMVISFCFYLPSLVRGQAFEEVEKDGININININIDGQPIKTDSRDDAFGALGDPNPTNLDTDEWTALNDLLVDDLEVNDDLFVLGDATITGDISATGDLDASRFTQGGGILASSTDVATGVLTEAQLIAYNQLDYTLTSAANTLTLAATSTFTTLIQTAGDYVTFKIRNVSPTSASSTTIAAGTGMDLVENENGDVVIEGGNEAYLRLTRETDTDITVSVDEYVASD